MEQKSRADDLTASQRSRVRSRVRRELAAAEEERESGGELNLVPFLDILVNTLIFLLASTAVAAPLAHIKATATEQRPVDEEARPPPGGELLLTVAIGRDGYYVGGVGGVAGGGEGPTLPCRGGPCLAGATDRYDRQGLARLAQQLKARYPDQRRVIITADPEVPYRVVVAAMDALRGTAAAPLFDGVVFGAP